MRETHSTIRELHKNLRERCQVEFGLAIDSIAKGKKDKDSREIHINWPGIEIKSR
jgi:hypothetical protein